MPEKPKKQPVAKKKPAAKAPKPATDPFIEAFVALLKDRKIKVPAGLADAPPEAHAHQPATIVAEQLARMPDQMLTVQAERIAGYAKRMESRATAEWEGSPLVAEIRRRKLPLPDKPTRVVGMSFVMKKPLKDWSDRELVEAAAEWSLRANSPRARG